MYSIFNYYFFFILFISMLLSNFIMFLMYQKNHYSNFLLRQRDHIKYNIIRQNHDLYSNKALLVMKEQANENSSEYFNASNNYDRLLSRNLFQKLINYCFQETVFLSTSNKFVLDYINQLRNMGLSIYDSTEYRNFLTRFSKDLISGKVRISSVNNNDYVVTSLEDNKKTYIRYVWSKFLDLATLKSIDFKKTLLGNLNNQSTINLNKSLPFFILVNNHNDIIMSESVDVLSNNINNNNLFNSFMSKFLNGYGHKNNYTCLLFINYYDAVEYKNYIIYKNKQSTNLSNIKIIPSNIYLYNKLKSYYKNTINFCVVPDLTEVSLLLKKYSKYRNIHFDHNQRHGYNFFQGQPLYRIQSLYMKSGNEQEIKSNKIYFFKKYNYLNTCFLNYDTAINAWQKLVKENSGLKLPSRPQISVSNLEFVLRDEKDTKSLDNMIFLPSFENYFFIKKYLQVNLKNEYTIKNWLLSQQLFVKTLCCRIFWSLTSRQPSNW